MTAARAAPFDESPIKKGNIKQINNFSSTMQSPSVFHLCLDFSGVYTKENSNSTTQVICKELNVYGFLKVLFNSEIMLLLRA